MEENENKMLQLVEMYRGNPAAAARDLLGIDLAPHQRVILKAMWDCNNVILVLSRGGGKCLRYNSLIQSDKGFQKIGDLCENNGSNFGLTEGEFNLYGENGLKTTSHTYKNKPKPIYNVKTKFGYNFGSVNKHMVRCLENGQIIWKRADKLSIGDNVIIDRTENKFNGKYNISKDEAYLIGALVGDGCFVKSGGVGFTNVDKDIINEFEKNYGLLGANSFSSLKEDKEYCLLFGSRNNDSLFFDKYGLKREKANIKEIPSPILQSNNSALAGFISGYADTDGSVTDKGVEFSSASELLLEQLQVILLSFGIISQRRHKKVKYKNGYKDAWTLLIGSNNAKIFAEKIGFRCKRKQQKLEELVKDKKFNPNHDTIKECKKLLIAVRNEFKKHTVFGYNNPEYRVFSSSRINSYDYGYENLNKFLDKSENICEEMEEWKQLKELSEKHYFIDTVKSVEILPDEVTYDVHIPDDHTFISNGFISHNTFIDAVFAVLRALLFPGEKVGIFGPSYRQSKFVFAEIEKIYDMSPVLRDCCEKRPTKMVDMCYLQFKSTNNRAGSVIHCLPLGDGSTIRGARYFTIICDEAAQVPREILDVVVRGMMATSKNPMEQVKALKEQKRLLKEGKIKKIKKLHNNKIILSSTAYYQYNHFWERASRYIDEIMDEVEDVKKQKYRLGKIENDYGLVLKGHDLNGQIPYNIMKDENRALIAFNWKDFPEGFMNEESIEEAKKDMPPYQHMMEYFAFFPPDSDGFFPMSYLDKARQHREFIPALSLKKESGYVNIMGIDPARSGDNFAIAIFRADLKERKIKLVRMLTYHKKPYPFMHLEIRRLMKLYNIDEIAMDSGGGGTTIRDLLADPSLCPPSESIILQRDFDEHRMKKGKKILRLVEFSRYEWVHNSNHNLLLGLHDGTLQIATDKGSLKEATDYNETPEEEESRIEIDNTITEIQNIVVTKTPSGRMHWDTPHKNQRKDRYSAVLIGYDMAYSYIENMNKPQKLAGGFWR